MIFIPSVKVTASGGTMSKVEVKWYLRNSSGSYDEVTDSTTLSQMNSVSIEITDYVSGSESERATLESSDYSYTPKDYSWSIPGVGNGSAQASDVAIGYVLNGVSYRF